MISEDQMRSRFPEARRSTGGEHFEYYVHCPKFHRKGGRFKMSINPDTGLFYCHDCGYAGNANETFFDQATNSFMFQRQKEQEENLERGPVLRRWNKVWEDGIPSPGKMKKLWNLPNEHPALNYLLQRGIDRERMEEFSLFYCTQGDYQFCEKLGTTTGRIIFPIHMNGKMVGWQARQVDVVTDEGKSIWKGEKLGWWIPRKITLDTGKEVYEDYEVPKYYTCPGMNRSTSFYNFDQAVAAGREWVVLVEGPVDVMKTHKRVIGSFGNRLSQGQIRILTGAFDNVYMILDSEVDEEVNWFKKQVEVINSTSQIKTMKLEGYHDPGSTETEEIWRQVEMKFGKLWK